MRQGLRGRKFSVASNAARSTWKDVWVLKMYVFRPLSLLDDLLLSLENLLTTSYGATSHMKPLAELLHGAATVEGLVSVHPQDATPEKRPLLELAINKRPEMQKTVC